MPDGQLADPASAERTSRGERRTLVAVRASRVEPRALVPADPVFPALLRLGRVHHFGGRSSPVQLGIR